MNGQLIRDYYAAFNARDYEGMLALLTDSVVHDVNQGTREHGRARFRAFLARMDRAYSEQVSGLVVLSEESGLRHAAEFVVSGRYLAAEPGFPPAHGQLYRLPAGAFFELSEGRIARVTTYYNVADWLAQVGAA